MELPERFVEADLEFHSALARATQNKLFLVLINPIVDLLRDARLLQFDAPGSPARGQESHKTILRCVELHDREGAQRAMQAHLKVMTESVLRAIGVPQARGNR
jgi:GntR family transcriptional repressor for pyruvate dehydrogenase complex